MAVLFTIIVTAVVAVVTFPMIVDIIDDAAAVPQPPQVFDDGVWTNDELFRARPWVRSNFVPADVVDQGARTEMRDDAGERPDRGGVYNRPLDVEIVPDDGILAPPRAIRGRNREA